MKLATKRSTMAATLLAALALLLAACGSGGDEEEEAEVDEEDLATVSIMIPFLEAQAPDDDGQMHLAMEEFTGKDLDVTWVPNSEYEERTNVTLASDDIPEIMVIQGKLPSFVQSAEAGAFWDLTDRLGDYPNLQPEIPEIEANSSVNGTLYGVFRGRDPMRAAVILRKDWLANLGLDLPETTDDLYEVARAFTQDDPDGNGQDDTYGLILPQWPGAGYGTQSPYDIIETWFGAPNRWGEVDGELVPGFDTPEFLEAMRFMKRMVDEGLVNPDYATMNPDNWNDPFFNGQGGIIVDVSSRAGVIHGLFKDADPENYDFVTMEGNLVGPDGERHSYPTTGWFGFLAISTQSVPTEAELDDVLSVLNELASEEGQVLMHNGIEDENFTPTLTEEEAGEELPGLGIGFAEPIEDDPEAEVITNDARAFDQMSASPAGNRGYDTLSSDAPEQELWDHRWTIHDRDLETAVHDPTQPLLSETEIARGAQLNQIVHDARIQFLAGQIDEDGLLAQLQRWHDEGGDDIVAEMNELYAGLDR